MRQTTDTVIMIGAEQFSANPKTAIDNKFARLNLGLTNDAEVKARAIAESKALDGVLMDAGVNVIHFPGTPGAPDGIFPNNWLSTDEDDHMVLYPMMASNRRIERVAWPAIRERLRRLGFQVDPDKIVDLSYLEREGQFLEGTGSLVLDRINNIAYAAISERTTIEAVGVFAKTFGYHPMTFGTADPDGQPVYHTNVVLALGSEFAVFCPDAVPDKNERNAVYMYLLDEALSNRQEVIEITWDQARSFCGNILELSTADGDRIVVMSETAKRAFRQDQLDKLEKWGGRIVAADIPTIEAVGGGGVRCMLAEVFLPRVGSDHFVG